MDAELTADWFAEHVDSSFVVAIDESETVTMRLTCLDRGSVRDHGARREPFSLTFVGPSGLVLQQHTYTFIASTGEAIDIFIVPVATGSDGVTQYQAVFN